MSKRIDHFMLRGLILLVVTVLLSSCAKPPHQELEAAEYMVGRAYAMRAIEYAPTEYTAARTALNDARTSMRDKDYGDAQDSLEFALKHARRAIVLAEEGQARKQAEAKAKLLQEEKEHQEAIEKAKKEEAARQLETIKPVAKPKPKPKAKIVKVANYDVGEGETLWTISAKPQVYNEGLLWPLLYQANRDQIKDPRQIFPGQTLSVRRDMSQRDLEEARQTARESDIFPVLETPSQKQ
jgi:nucleoid-associated protein YgaU